MISLTPRLYHNLKRFKYRLTERQSYKAFQDRRTLVTSESYSYKPFDELECIFVHVPKCAGVSVSHSLFGNLAGGHTSFEEYLLIFEPSTIASYFKFTFVRNPWDRLCSAFHFLKAGGFVEEDKRWAEENLSDFDDFETFVKKWLNKENIWKWPHFKPQYHFIRDPGCKFDLDFVGFFENIDKDFPHIAELIGENCELQQMNSGQHKDFRSYYNDDTIKIVSEVYAQDIALLGYNFDNSSIPVQISRRNTGRLYANASIRDKFGGQKFSGIRSFFKEGLEKTSPKYSIIEKGGVVVYDLAQFVWAMRPSAFCTRNDFGWVSYCNRNERLLYKQSARGVLCDWQGPTALWATSVFPALGLFLLRKALTEWPIGFKDHPHLSKGKIDLSFIIGHKGSERLSNLCTIIKSIAAQVEVSIECIVVDQSMNMAVKDVLPEWVRYVHTPATRPDVPFSRSWALNVGARLARGQLLVFNDNDLCPPIHYGQELLKHHSRGYEVIRLQRFRFELDKVASVLIKEDNLNLPKLRPAVVLQNLVGGTLAVDRKTYFRLGGHDEAFVGWGGEDDEFYQRCQTAKLYGYAYLPFVHLYHKTELAKGESVMTKELFEARAALPVYERVEELKARDFGNRKGMDPPYFPVKPVNSVTNR